MSVASQVSPTHVAKRLNMSERQLPGTFNGGRSEVFVRCFQRKGDSGFAPHLL